MKKLIYGTLFLAVVGIGFNSCEKEELLTVVTEVKETPNPPPNTKEGQVNNWVVNDMVSYFLDGDLVTPGAYDPADESLFVLIEGDSIENYVHFNAFTTVEQYFAYGRNNGYDDNLENGYLFEQHMSQYALDNGIIEVYENTGQVPEEYLQYEEQMYIRIFDIVQASDRLVLPLPLILYLNAGYGGGTNISWTGYKPYFIANAQWNNAVSRYNKWTLFGFVSVYDKSFFRKRIGTIGRWGFQDVVFVWQYGLHYYNDKMSSVIS